MAANRASDIQIKIPPIRQGGRNRSRFMPTVKPKNMKNTILRLLKVYSEQWRLMTVALILVFASSAIALLVPYLLGMAVNAFNIKTNIVNSSMLNIVIIALIGTYLAGYIIDSSSGWLMAGLTQRLVKSMRRSLFAKLQKLPLNFYDTHSHGDMMSRLTNDIDNISSTISQTTTQLMSSIITILGSLIMMLVLSPLLTLAALVTIPLVFILTKAITKRSRLYFAEQQRTLGNLNGLIEESIYGLKMVKAFNREEILTDNFKFLNDQLCEYSTKAQIWSGFMMPLMNVINNIGFASIACVGGLLAINNLIVVGTITSFLSYSRQFGMPLNNIASMLNTIQSAIAGAERVFEILDEAQEPDDKKDAKDISYVEGKVEFRKVFFSYDKNTKVLNNVSFVVKPGEVVALVGETGAGKTTIVNLLTRFYDTDSGEILIDDVNILDYTRDSLRKCFSVVLQDTCLFTGTIMENIRYGNPQATDEQVRAAAVMANADHFIKHLPKGYNTPVSGNVDTLSQGQRQLLAIARAILCDAPILILDEATSSVDTRTELKIEEAMLKLMKGRTCYLIAHRLSTIRDADKIMVIGNGEILESGNHDSLMKELGNYYNMVISQMGMNNV